MSRRSLAHSLLVFLFLLAQALVLVHGMEHGLERPGDGQHHGCSLCISGHDLGAALPCASKAIFAGIPQPRMFGELVLQAPDPALPFPRQRGPPLYS